MLQGKAAPGGSDVLASGFSPEGNHLSQVSEAISRPGHMAGLSRIHTPGAPSWLQTPPAELGSTCPLDRARLRQVSPLERHSLERVYYFLITTTIIATVVTIFQM